jgi:hypothetical protein
MQNAAYRLALLAAIGGLLLLMWAPQGGGVENALGTALLAVAGLLVGLGTVIDLLGYVEEGATDAEDLDG